MASYWFYPNPGSAYYNSPKVILLLILFVSIFAVSFYIQRWRKSQTNSITKKLSRSWPGAMRWLSGIGLILVIARVEEIQFLAMRFLVALLFLSMLLYTLFQFWMWKKRHYTIIQKPKESDPREKYLPKSK